MQKNSLLSIADIFTGICKIFTAIGIIGLTVFFIHFQTDRDFYDSWRFEEPVENSIVRFESESVVGKEPPDFDKLRLSDWKLESLYFTFFKYLFILSLIYLALNQFGNVLNSVKSSKTFQQTNVTAFRKIGYYSLTIAGLSLISYWEFGDFSKNSFSISLNNLIIPLFAFILAEIFKEGNNLKEENQLTI